MAFHFHAETETKLIQINSVMTKSFISKFIEPNGIVSHINSYIHTYINPQPNKYTV